MRNHFFFYFLIVSNDPSGILLTIRDGRDTPPESILGGTQ